jgi:transcriptional regulator with XRE-family HTH domain
MKGNKLPKWRAQNGGYTQSGLKKEFGLKSRGTISKLENSSVELQRLYALALTALSELLTARNFFFEKKKRNMHNPAELRSVEAK